MTQNLISSSLRNNGSYVKVGARDEPNAPQINPLAFAIYNPSTTPDGPMKAGCAKTDHKWDPKYNQTRYYIYTAPDRSRL
jgi:hypothetical protein